MFCFQKKKKRTALTIKSINKISRDRKMFPRFSYFLIEIKYSLKEKQKRDALIENYRTQHHSFDITVCFPTYIDNVR